jgi:hypothetical protein
MPRIQVPDQNNPAVPRLLSRLKSQTTLGSITDGTANTAMLGEKCMHPEWLGSIDLEKPVSINMAWHPYYSTRILGYTDPKAVISDHSPTLARGLPNRLPIPRSSYYDYVDQNGQTKRVEVWIWGFGGWHPHVTLFTFADATVHPIRNNIDPFNILPYLAGRNDGIIANYQE